MELDCPHEPSPLPWAPSKKLTLVRVKEKWQKMFKEKVQHSIAGSEEEKPTCKDQREASKGRFQVTASKEKDTSILQMQELDSASNLRELGSTYPSKHPVKNTALPVSWFWPWESLSRGSNWTMLYRTSNLQKCEMINECHFKLLNGW